MVWSAEVFSKDETLEDSLRVLNFCRDNLAHFPLKQNLADVLRLRPTCPTGHSRPQSLVLCTVGIAPESPRLVAKGSGAMTIGIGEETKRVFMVPMPRNPHFVGREAELQALRDALQDRKNVLLTQAISGLGGIGKTQTACEYAYRHRDEYRAVLWTSAENESAPAPDTGRSRERSTCRSRTLWRQTPYAARYAPGFRTTKAICSSSITRTRRKAFVLSSPNVPLVILC